jgi:acetyltransferase
MALGCARACADPENADAEFAVLVRSDWKGRGLEAVLLRKLIQYCRERGTQRMTGQVLSDNARMLKLAASVGFRLEHRGEGLVELALELRSADPGSAGPAGLEEPLRWLSIPA